MSEPDPAGSREVARDRAERLLAEGDIELLGLLRNSSNYTFLARVSDAELSTLAVYKPRDGETPLWDFPDGTLYLREIAAFEASERLGFGFVPLTILREGPHGIGSLQVFIDADTEQHYLTLPEEYDDVFMRVCAFDLLINNADRKSGHCLLETSSGRIWVVDHGVAFHAEPKLRTVIWDYAGRPIPQDAKDAIARLADELEDDPAPFHELLSAAELRALIERGRRIQRMRVFPRPGPGRPYPWPPI